MVCPPPSKWSKKNSPKNGPKNGPVHIAPRWRPDFEQRSRCHVIVTMLKTRFYFLYASTSLDTKTLTIASNRNFESCLSICCLAPQHIFRFFHLCRGFSPLSLATLLIVKSSSSTLYRAIEIKKRVCEWLLFAGNHDPSSLAPGGSVVPLVCGFRR